MTCQISGLQQEPDLGLSGCHNFAREPADAIYNDV